MIQHFAIYLSNDDDKNWLIQEIFSGKFYSELIHAQGKLYSEIYLNEFIDEEIKHEHSAITETIQRSVQSMSDGEKKKALLAFIISKNPDFIVVDNIFDNLDIVSQKEITDTITALSNHTIIIQIANRKSDILSFIKNVYTIQEKKIVLQTNDRKDVLKNNFTHLQTIPPSYDSIPILENSLVKFENVTVKYDGRTIVRNICWEIKSGEFWQLKGPNGSGKSTLLSMITGDNPKGYGQNLFLFGRKKGSGESVWSIKKKIGYLTPSMSFQFPRLDSIEKMVISGFVDSVGLYVHPTDIQIHLSEQWLSLIGMDAIKHKPFLSLSLGHQRLVMIVRAMVKHPPLLILDEPTVGLDDQDAAVFIELVNKIATETTTAILYVSHRNETGLNPKFIFELEKTEDGFIGKKI